MADALPCAVPGFARRCQLVSLPRPFPQPARYCLSFTAAGLKPELAPSSQQKVRSALLQMLRDAGLLAGKPGKGGTLGSVQWPLVTPQVQAMLEDDDPSLLAGFLLEPASRQHKAGQSIETKPRASAKSGSKPTRKPATKPAGQAAAKAAPGTPPKPVIKRATSPARRQAS